MRSLETPYRMVTDFKGKSLEPVFKCAITFEKILPNHSNTIKAVATVTTKIMPEHSILFQNYFCYMLLLYDIKQPYELMSMLK